MKLSISLAGLLAAIVNNQIVSAAAVVTSAPAPVKLHVPEVSTTLNTSIDYCGAAWIKKGQHGDTLLLEHLDPVFVVEQPLLSAHIMDYCTCTFYEHLPCLDAGWTTTKFDGDLPFPAKCFKC